MLWLSQQPQNSEKKNIKKRKKRKKTCTCFTVNSECKGKKGKPKACSITGMSCYDTWRTFHEVCFKTLLYLRGFKSQLNCFRATAVQTWSLWDFHLTQVLSGTNVVHLMLRTVCNNKVSSQRGCPAVLRPGCSIVSFGNTIYATDVQIWFYLWKKFICFTNGFTILY